MTSPLGRKGYPFGCKSYARWVERACPLDGKGYPFGWKGHALGLERATPLDSTDASRTTTGMPFGYIRFFAELIRKAVGCIGFILARIIFVRERNHTVFVCNIFRIGRTYRVNVRKFIFIADIFDNLPNLDFLLR